MRHISSAKVNVGSRQFLPVVLSIVLISCGCISARRTPNLEQIFAAAKTTTGKRPVIIIPGILGTELINPETKETVWPSAFRTRTEALPMTPELATNKDALVAGKIIEKLKLSRVLPEVYVYRDLLEALRHYAGYTQRDWEDVGPGGDKDSFYVFPYDWRLDNVANARELVRRIESLKVRLNRPDLKFNIIAHSMGGLIARYAAMYGDADLPASDGEIRPTWAGSAHISKIVMIGVPNEGSADALTTLTDGYSITEGIRRRVPLLNKLTAEDAVSSPAVFQLLPHSGTEKFLDENLKPITLDLYDVQVWKSHNWSPLFSPDFIRRTTNHDGSTSYEARAQQLEAYLAAMLKRTKRFHRALDSISNATSPVALMAIGGDCEETLSAPIIMRDEKRNRWITLIRPKEFRSSSGVKFTKKQVTEAMYLPGDGRVTRASLLGENIMRTRHEQTGVTLSSFAVFGCDLHGQLPRNKSLQDNALSAIVNEVIR